MGVGACGDSAPRESFFALLKKNFLNRQRCDVREELRLAIVTWIEKTYRRRWRRALGKLTPMALDLLHDQLAIVA